MNAKVLALAAIAIIAVAAIGGYFLLKDDGNDDVAKDDDEQQDVSIKVDTGIKMPEETLLRVFGNVNGDSYIDNKDVSMLNDILDGKAKQTYYADVNQDGVLDKKDVTALKTLMDGKETRAYYQNYNYDTMSCKVPIGKITVIYYQVVEAVVLLGAFDQIVASDQYSCVDKASQFPGIEKAKNLGDKAEITAEDLMSTGAKTIISGSAKYHISSEVEKQLPADYDMIRLCNGASGLEIVWHVVTLGYLLGSPGGYAYLDFYNEIMDLIDAKLKNVPVSSYNNAISIYFDDAKKYKIHCKNSGTYEVVEFAGAKELAEGMFEKYDTLYYYPPDNELLYSMEKNPGLDNLVFTKKSKILGSNEKEFMDEFYNYMKSSNLYELKSYQDGNAIAICYNLTNSTPLMLGSLVIASLLHPDEFKGVDVYDYIQRFYDDFTMMDFDVKTDAYFFCTSQDLIDKGYDLSYKK